MARIGAAATPKVEAPRGVKPFLHFARLPEQALLSVRRALDEDDDFRARVEMLADEAELGRAGWLFLSRPGGWDTELSVLAGEAQAAAEAEQEEREERSARRRLASAEAATQRAEAGATRARAEAAKAAAELAVERRERRVAQDEASSMARRAASLEGERDSARRRAEEAKAEADRLRVQCDHLRAERSAPAAVDVPAVAEAVAAAALAAESLSRALEEASAALGPSAPNPVPTPSPSPGAPPPLRPGPGGPARRRPVALPPAVFDDTVEAAKHLVRVPGVLVLVDGYNAAKALWPEVTPLELRERLVDALSELEARTGTGIHVVFDGADLGGPATRLTGRRGVRVSFSPDGVEADDVILDLIEEVPVEQPVVVSSSDRRVQEGARTRGASVISSAQLAAVLGRA